MYCDSPSHVLFFLCSCYAHAVSIADEKLLKALSPSKKRSNCDGDEELVPIVAPFSEKLAADEEETEEDIQKLQDVVNNATRSHHNSQEVETASLLLKICGFIAKVCAPSLV